ncbi:hypothetical protein UFOVP836_54 [uncultured Caudovirales phage]|uniref:Uncharacterized protein n=1 Tax=uncultured Caudovirales phage TaxID=2100421 RepID=A0A6J5PBY2_9CAUD|nr:hypothetical protein UFOVP836_54 [uncultured Caudovirales phage]
MKLRTAAVIATTDDGDKIGGPYFLPLDTDAKTEINQLVREHGPLDITAKEQSCSTKK